MRPRKGDVTKGLNLRSQYRLLQCRTVTVTGFEGLTGVERNNIARKFLDILTAHENGSMDPDKINRPLVITIIVAIMLMVTAAYAPLAAMLVELFPARIRYTSMSLPYHIGNGWFGGFLPTTAFAMVAATGNIYYGLWYPVLIAGMTAVVGILFLPETFRRKIDD